MAESRATERANEKWIVRIVRCKDIRLSLTGFLGTLKEKVSWFNRTDSALKIYLSCA